jgi:hypothetical protein
MIKSPKTSSQPFRSASLPIYKASAIGLLTRRELNVGGEG